MNGVLDNADLSWIILQNDPTAWKTLRCVIRLWREVLLNRCTVCKEARATDDIICRECSNQIYEEMMKEEDEYNQALTTELLAEGVITEEEANCYWCGYGYCSKHDPYMY